MLLYVFSHQPTNQYFVMSTGTRVILLYNYYSIYSYQHHLPIVSSYTYIKSSFDVIMGCASSTPVKDGKTTSARQHNDSRTQDSSQKGPTLYVGPHFKQIKHLGR